MESYWFPVNWNISERTSVYAWGMTIAFSFFCRAKSVPKISLLVFQKKKNINGSSKNIGLLKELMLCKISEPSSVWNAFVVVRSIREKELTWHVLPSKKSYSLLSIEVKEYVFSSRKSSKKNLRRSPMLFLQFRIEVMR